MRLVEVRSGTRTIRLHQRLTVAPDLDGAALAAALRGERGDVTVVVEVDGEEQELTADLARRLGFLGSTVDSVLRTADLPLPAPTPATAAPPDPEPAPAAEPSAAPQVDDSRLTEAQAQLAAAESAAADSKAAFDKADAAYREAQEALARARETEPSAGAGGDDQSLRQAEQRLEEARARTADARRRLVEARDAAAAGASKVDEMQRRVAALEDERQALQVEAQAATDADPKKVEESLAGLRRLSQVKPKVSDEALAIADRWAEAKARLGQLPAPPAPPEWLVEPALAALQDAREAVARAEQGYLPFSVEPAHVDELERAHREVLDAEQKVMRKPSRLARRKLDQAHAAERQALQAIGVSSYGDYLQRVAPVLENPSSEEHLSRARAALADAEAVWEELHGGQASAEYTAVREEMLGVKAEAVALLGSDPGEEKLEDALRNRTEAVVDTTWARQALADALRKVGVAADVDDQDELERTAERWLAEAPDTAARRAEVDERLRAIDEELAALQEQVSSKKENDFFGAGSEPAAGSDAGDPLAALQSAIDAAATAEADAEAALAEARNQAAGRADEAGAEVQRLQTASEEAKAAADEARRRLEESEAALEAARRAAQEAAEAVAAAAAAAEAAAAEAAAAEAAAASSQPEQKALAATNGAVVSIEGELYLLARVAAVRSAGLPLVIDDAFAGLSAPARDRMHRIVDRTADSVQVLYLTDSADAAGWVGGLGDRAALAAS